MEVILLQKIENLGDLGEKVKVKPGYARNHLIPKSLAKYATEENLKEFEEQKALIGLERYLIIRSLDRRWQDHLTEMEELRRSVNLRSYGQKDALNEYKSEAYVFFQ